MCCHKSLVSDGCAVGLCCCRCGEGGSSGIVVVVVVVVGGGGGEGCGGGGNLHSRYFITWRLPAGLSLPPVVSE